MVVASAAAAEKAALQRAASMAELKSEEARRDLALAEEGRATLEEEIRDVTQQRDAERSELETKWESERSALAASFKEAEECWEEEREELEQTWDDERRALLASIKESEERWEGQREELGQKWEDERRALLASITDSEEFWEGERRALLEARQKSQEAEKGWSFRILCSKCAPLQRV